MLCSSAIQQCFYYICLQLKAFERMSVLSSHLVVWQTRQIYRTAHGETHAYITTACKYCTFAHYIIDILRWCWQAHFTSCRVGRHRHTLCIDFLYKAPPAFSPSFRTLHQCAWLAGWLAGKQTNSKCTRVVLSLHNKIAYCIPLNTQPKRSRHAN